MGPEGQATASEGTFSFFAYYEGEKSDRIEPDKRWTFNAAQVQQAKTSASFGEVYSFWLPIGEVRAESTRIRLLSTFVSATGVKLVSQAVVAARKPSSIVEQKTIKNAEPKREAPAEAAPEGAPRVSTPSAPAAAAPAAAAAAPVGPPVVAVKNKIGRAHV